MNVQYRAIEESSPRTLVRRLANLLQRAPNTFNIVNISGTTVSWVPLTPQQGEWTIYVRFINGPTCEFKMDPDQTVDDLQQRLQQQQLPHRQLRFQGQLLTPGLLKDQINDKAILNGSTLP
jgi:hypothetical protein